MPIGIPLGGNFTVTSNISSLMKRWSERTFFNVGREFIVMFIKNFK